MGRDLVVTLPGRRPHRCTTLLSRNDPRLYILTISCPGSETAKSNESGRQRLGIGGALRLAEGVIGVDQHRVAAKQDLQVAKFFFGGNPGAAAGHKIAFLRVGHFQCGHHESVGLPVHAP